MALLGAHDGLYAVELAADLLHFGNKTSILFLLFILLALAIDCRGMDGNKSNRTGVQLDELTAFLRNPHRFAQNRLRCRCAHANHDLRPHDLDSQLPATAYTPPLV